LPSSVQLTTRERAEKAVKNFKERIFNPELELKQQRKRKEIGTIDIDWTRVKKGDLLYISSKFDKLEWWKEVGQVKHDLVYLVAPPIIAIPSSNGLLERIFSSCSWFDDSLHQSLKPRRFEMAILMSVNESFLDNGDYVPSEERAQDIVQSVIDIFEGDDDLGFDVVTDLRLDVNGDNFVVGEEDDNEDYE